MEELEKAAICEKEPGLGEFWIHDVLGDAVSREVSQCTAIHSRYCVSIGLACQGRYPPSSVRINVPWFSDLLTTSLLSIVCFAISVYFGFSMEGRANLQQHILFGLFATFLVTLAQSMTMFYFIGTGKQVKDLVISHSITEGFVQRTKVFKARVFPPALWAMLFTMATMILGGGVHTKLIPSWVHLSLAVAALLFNLQAFCPGGEIHDRAQCADAGTWRSACSPRLRRQNDRRWELWNPIVYPSRLPFPPEIPSEDIQAFIESREQEYPSKLEDEFAARALTLGIDSGILLDVGTRAGLTALKIVWHNENLVAMGLDISGRFVERARETATAWNLNERGVFQVGDPRSMRFKDWILRSGCFRLFVASF